MLLALYSIVSIGLISFYLVIIVFEAVVVLYLITKLIMGSCRSHLISCCYHLLQSGFELVSFID